jgi:glycerol-3-phosphate acyltransferase PlsY
MLQALAIIVAYLLGSIPTAVIVSRWRRGIDIRTVGNGNMGGHNTAQVLGFKAGLIVAIADMLKGSFALLFARALGLSIGWQMVVGVFAIAGHDFPVFAGFKGGQGSATTLGVFLVLFPVPTVISMIVLLLLYLITRKYNLATPVAGGLLLVLAWQMHQPWTMLVYMLILYLCIPLKKMADSHRVKELGALPDNHTSENSR